MNMDMDKTWTQPIIGPAGQGRTLFSEDFVEELEGVSGCLQNVAEVSGNACKSQRNVLAEGLEKASGS